MPASWQALTLLAMLSVLRIARALPVGNAVIRLMIRIAMPKHVLATMPKDVPWPPRRRSGTTGRVPPNHQLDDKRPRPAPDNRADDGPDSGMGMSGVPTIPPTSPPMTAPIIPRFDPPAAFEPAAPAANSTTSATPAITVIVTSDGQPTYGSTPVTHAKSPCPSTISQSPGSPSRFTNRPVKSRTMSKVVDPVHGDGRSIRGGLNQAAIEVTGATSARRLRGRLTRD